MPESTADATWNGTVTDGEGHAALDSDVWAGRYATPDVEDATDPEELLAASHASCYAMTAAYALEGAGYSPEHVDAEATVTLDVEEAGFTIDGVDLTVAAAVPDADDDEVTAVLEGAEAHCPVSKALAGPDVTVTATTTSAD